MTPRSELPSPGLPRRELSIGHPEFDAFLSAPVGEDADSVELSVMSALAATLGQVPAGSWKQAGDRPPRHGRGHRRGRCRPSSG